MGRFIVVPHVFELILYMFVFFCILDLKCGFYLSLGYLFLCIEQNVNFISWTYFCSDMNQWVFPKTRDFMFEILVFSKIHQ